MDKPIYQDAVYIEIFHGKKSLGEQLGDWGEEGPVLGPFAWVHVTYNSRLACGPWPEGNGDPHDLQFVDDLLYYDGMLYGDYSIMPGATVTKAFGKDAGRVQNYEESKATPPPELKHPGMIIRPSSEAIARRFHAEYERLAPRYGYETRKASAVEWGDVPDNNRHLMIAVASVVRHEYFEPYIVLADIMMRFLRELESCLDNPVRSVDWGMLNSLMDLYKSAHRRFSAPEKEIDAKFIMSGEDIKEALEWLRTITIACDDATYHIQMVTKLIDFLRLLSGDLP